MSRLVAAAPRAAWCLTATTVALSGLSAACQIAASTAQVATDSPSAHAARVKMDLRDAGEGEELRIVVGHSMVIHAGSAVRKIYIGNPAVLQSYVESPTEIVLTAKAPGLSGLVVWGASGESCLYTVTADVDPSRLQKSLLSAYPSSAITSEAHEGRVYLTGNVGSQEIADGAVKLATPYAKEVINSLRVVPVHAKQVQLKLRIVEVDRTRMEQYGINFFSGGKILSSTSTLQSGSTTTGTLGSSTIASAVSDPLNVLLYSQTLNVGVTVKDLEQKQVLQVLAEPTITSISGQPARFLSGGEFPFPVVQGGSGNSTAITINFRPYGVKVDFASTVNEDGTIRLKVAPEVSTLDFTNAVTISGFTIPALSTRRAETEVEIQSGQSFAVSGLLDHRTSESLSHLPGISSIPILGQIFRSKAYNHSVVELVVMVTATVVDPLADTPQMAEPKMAVPNMESGKFDTSLSKLQRVNPKN